MTSADLTKLRDELEAAYAEFPAIGADRGSIIKAANRVAAARWSIFVAETGNEA